MATIYGIKRPDGSIVQDVVLCQDTKWYCADRFVSVSGEGRALGIGGWNSDALKKIRRRGYEVVPVRVVIEEATDD